MSADRGPVHILGMARLAATGETGDWSTTNRMAFEHAWTVDTYRLLARLGEHALAAGSWVSQIDTLHRNLGLSALQAATLRLTDVAEQACLSGARRDEALAWAEVLAATPGLSPGVLLEMQIATWDIEIVQWHRAANQWAPLAYAAGLDRSEARELRRTGALDEAGLRTLIALARPDWQFPVTALAEV